MVCLDPKQPWYLHRPTIKPKQVSPGAERLVYVGFNVQKPNLNVDRNFVNLSDHSSLS